MRKGPGIAAIRTRATWRALAAAMFGVAVPHVAAAQSAGNGRAATVAVEDNVAERLRPGYSPIGIPVGGFRLYPSLEARAGYDSNIYALPGAPVDDLALFLTPRLALTSIENRRYAVSVVAEATVARFARRTSENSESIAAVASGRLEIDRDTQLLTGLTIARRVQRRGTEDEVLIGALPPVGYRELTATVAGERRFGLLTARLGGNVGQFRYEAARINGVRVPLGDNNFEQRGVNGRVAVAVGPAFGVFGTASYNASRYARSTRLPSRDSSGYTALGGITFVTPLIEAELGVGYISQSFRVPAYGDIRGINYAARATWRPLRVIDVQIDLGRRFQRSALLGAAGIRLDTASLGVDYELLRNVILNAGLSYTLADYRGLDRRERRLDALLGARYLANANLSLVASVSAVQQHRAAGAALGRDYDRLRVSVGARLQL